MIRRETLCMTQTVETTTEEPNDTTGNTDIISLHSDIVGGNDARLNSLF